MSQAKVDYKKEQRKNIKKTIRKRKISHVIGMVVFVLIACGIIGWLGFSVYQTYTEAKASEPAARENIPIDLDAISDYISDIEPEEETDSPEEVTVDDVEYDTEDTQDENTDSTDAESTEENTDSTDTESTEENTDSTDAE